MIKIIDDYIRRVQVDAVGRDEHGEPVCSTWATDEGTDWIHGGRMRVWVLPVTEDEHLTLSEALARSDTGLVDFDVPQSRFAMTRNVQALRQDDLHAEG